MIENGMEIVMYLGHISEDGLREQPLSEHLFQTADLAKRFADVFHAGDWGYLCGILHDVGKYSEEFQQRIHGKNIKVDHSAAGAREAQNLRPPCRPSGWDVCGGLLFPGVHFRQSLEEDDSGLSQL